jgi:hypothetical protein
MGPPVAVACCICWDAAKRGAKCPRLHAREKHTRHERSPRIVGRVGGMCGLSDAGPHGRTRVQARETGCWHQRPDVDL